MTISLANPTTTSAPDLTLVDWVHRTLRRDALRLEATLEGPITRRKARQLVRWYARYERFMTEHHAREDEQFFPVLSTADPDCADLVAEMADEHGQLEDAFAQVGRALDGLRRRGRPCDQRLALASAQKFRDVLERHLDHEEIEVLPRFTAAVAATYVAREAAVVQQMHRRHARYDQALVEAA